MATLISSMRCPNCLELGKLKPFYGYYCCDVCNQRFGIVKLDEFNKAFNLGVQYQKFSGDEPKDS